MRRIISDSESRQILKNDLMREARQRYDAQLESADPEERQKIMNRIEGEVEEELRRRERGRRFLSRIFSEGDGLLH